MLLEERLKGCFYGGIVGDIYGMPYEFLQEEDLIDYPEYKSGEYFAGGPFCLKKGYYTDDTSMVLCLAESIITNDCVTHHAMHNYTKWYKDGYMSSTGALFDIGNQCRRSIEHYSKYNEFINEREDAAGNGALMRTSAIIVPYFASGSLYRKSRSQTIITHNNDDALKAASYFASFFETINDFSIEKSKEIIQEYLNVYFNPLGPIKGRGYVYDSLRIAAESFIATDNFIDSIIHSISYAGDTDTNASITGMLTGFAYGIESIPKNLLEIKDKEMIDDIFERLIACRK